MASYSNTCSICLEDILEADTKVITLDCKHPFHTLCLSQLRTNKCPTCRRRFTNISPEILSKIIQRENSDILSRNAEDFNELLINFIRDNEFQDAQTPPPVFVEFVDLPPEPSVFPLAFITISLIRAIPPRYPISLLLNTQFQGVTIQTMLENYIVRHFTA